MERSPFQLFFLLEYIEPMGIGPIEAHVHITSLPSLGFWYGKIIFFMVSA
jgi:hypothetical protein